MSTVGELLKKTRESKGLSLQQVEDETNMRWKYIEALEEGNYEVIPGSAYVRGFLRNYSAFLGLEPEEMLEQYKLEQQKTAAPSQSEEPKRPSRRPSRSLGLPVYLLLAAAILGALVYSGRNWLPSKPAPTPAPTPVRTNPASGQAQVGEKTNRPPAKTPTTPTTPPKQTPTLPVNPPLPSTAVSLQLTASAGQSWISVTVDGKRAYSGFLTQGQTMSFSAGQLIHVRYGNAGAVEVIHQSKNLGRPGAIGQVINKDYTK